jgi:hypothetical protein
MFLIIFFIIIIFYGLFPIWIFDNIFYYSYKLNFYII